jgi:hypothetical protein
MSHEHRWVAILCAALLSLCITGIAYAAVSVTNGVWTLEYTGAKVATESLADCNAKGLMLPEPIRSRTWRCVQMRVTKKVADLPPPPPPARVDCVVSDWSPWDAGPWSACIDGVQARTESHARTIVTPAANGGATCPALTESRSVTQICAPPPDPIPVPTGNVVFASPPVADMAALKPGDTLVLHAGAYTSLKLKACTAAAWCTVRAGVDGAVTVTGLSIGAGNWFTSIEGMKFTGSSGKRVLGSFVKLKRVAFEGGPASGNDVSLQIGSSEVSAKQVLIEDSWVYGFGGRYKVLVYNGDGVILRRVVVRHDGGWAYDSRNPQGGFSLYDSRNVACQDCLFVDPVASLAGFEAAMYLVSNGTTAFKQTGVSVTGAVLIGSPNNGLAAEGNGTAATYSVSDIAIAGSKQGALNTNNAGHTLNATRVYASVAGTAFGRWASSGSIKVTDCVVAKGTASSGATLTRCPGGSGPILARRTGVAGTLFGEPGFDQVTDEPLWPYPNEARIKADFDSVRAAFGGKSLTEYVWQSLGTAPPLPEVTELRAVEDPDGTFNSVVTAWVRDDCPACWRLGWAPLEYHDDADTPQVMEPFPPFEEVEYSN